MAQSCPGGIAETFSFNSVRALHQQRPVLVWCTTCCGDKNKKLDGTPTPCWTGIAISVFPPIPGADSKHHLSLMSRTELMELHRHLKALPHLRFPIRRAKRNLLTWSMCESHEVCVCHDTSPSLLNHGQSPTWISSHTSRSFDLTSSRLWPA